MRCISSIVSRFSRSLISDVVGEDEDLQIASKKNRGLSNDKNGATVVDI